MADGKFQQALDLYSQAIDINPNVAAYYGNRSLAYLRLESFGYALSDADNAISLDNMYIKVCSLTVIHPLL